MCNWKTEEALLAQKEKKIESELLQGKTTDGKEWVRCARVGCGKPLGTGPRWWICSRVCGKECTSVVHKAWGKAQTDDASIIGQDAV